MLDPRTTVQYYGACLTLVLMAAGSGGSGCRGLPETIAPEGLKPVTIDEVQSWIDDLGLRHPRLYQARWLFQNQRGSTGGRIAIRVAPPDSMRIDIRGQLGRSGAAAVVGNSVIWARPEEEFRGLLDVTPVFWAVLGVAVRPPAGADIFALESEGVKAWRYVIRGDTLNFVIEDRQPKFLAELRRTGRPIGIAEVRFSAETGLPTGGKIELPLQVARFSFTVRSVDTLATFKPDIWAEP